VAMGASVLVNAILPQFERSDTNVESRTSDYPLLSPHP
jgi:hypothetical protein